MNVKRNFLTSVLLSTLIGVGVIGVGAGVASAADYSALIKLGFFGSPAKKTPDTTVKISGTTKAFRVDHLATVKIENDKGQSFVWLFDTALMMSIFPLKTIAPSGFDAGDAVVNVTHTAAMHVL